MKICKTTNDHDANSKKICLFCFAVDTRSNKSKFTNILPEVAIEKKINLLFEYSVSKNELLPSALRSGCCRKSYRIGALKVPDLTEFHESKKARSSSKVQCQYKICRIVRKPLFQTIDVRNVAEPKNRTKHNLY